MAVLVLVIGIILIGAMAGVIQTIGILRFGVLIMAGDIRIMADIIVLPFTPGTTVPITTMDTDMEIILRTTGEEEIQLILLAEAHIEIGQIKMHMEEIHTHVLR